jgi:hypothetical protein
MPTGDEPFHFQLVEWVIAAGQIPGRFRGIANLLCGILNAAAFSGIAAWQAENASMLAIGLLASVEAAKVHDGQGELVAIGAPEPDPPASAAAESSVVDRLVAIHRPPASSTVK